MLGISISDKQTNEQQLQEDGKKPHSSIPSLKYSSFILP